MTRYAINTVKLIVAFVCFIIGQIFVTASINSIFDIVPRITRIFPAANGDKDDDDDDDSGDRPVKKSHARPADLRVPGSGGGGGKSRDDVIKGPMNRAETVTALAVNSGAVSTVSGARR